MSLLLFVNVKSNFLWWKMSCSVQPCRFILLLSAPSYNQITLVNGFKRFNSTSIRKQVATGSKDKPINNAMSINLCMSPAALLRHIAFMISSYLFPRYQHNSKTSQDLQSGLQVAEQVQSGFSCFLLGLNKKEQEVEFIRITHMVLALMWVLHGPWAGRGRSTRHSWHPTNLCQTSKKSASCPQNDFQWNS